MRNVWGELNWKGDWSPSSRLWNTDNKQILEYDPSEDSSVFWMKLEDFKELFKSVSVVRLKNWEETRSRGKFLRIQDKVNLSNEIVLSRWYY